jgi:hypothetical protein
MLTILFSLTAIFVLLRPNHNFFLADALILNLLPNAQPARVGRISVSVMRRMERSHPAEYASTLFRPTRDDSRTVSGLFQLANMTAQCIEAGESNGIPRINVPHPN